MQKTQPLWLCSFPLQVNVHLPQFGTVPDHCFGKGTAEETPNITWSSSPTRKSKVLLIPVPQYRTKGPYELGSRRVSQQDLSGLPRKGPSLCGCVPSGQYQKRHVSQGCAR